MVIAVEDWLAMGKGDECFESPTLIGCTADFYSEFQSEIDDAPDFMIPERNYSTTPGDSGHFCDHELIMEEVYLQAAGELAVFWIHLSEEAWKDNDVLECFVRGPTGLRYPVFITRDPLINNLNRFRCSWRPLESGIHKGVAFLNDTSLHGSPFFTDVHLMDVDGEDSKTEPLDLSKMKSNFTPRQLKF